MISVRRSYIFYFLFAALLFISATTFATVVDSAQTEFSDMLGLSSDEAAFMTALSTQDLAIANSLSNDALHFGFGYGAWSGDWEDISKEQTLAFLLARSSSEQLSVEVLPDEAVDFLGGLNPMRDLMPEYILDGVLLVRGWEGNSDAQALLFFTPSEGGSELLAVVYSTTGFDRVSHY